MGAICEAVVFEKPREVRVRRVQLPDLAPRDVLTRTLVSGISAGTEGWVLTNRYKGTIDKFPHIPGYQRAGIVEAVGSQVTRFKPADRVFSRGSKLAPGQDIHPESWNGQMGMAVCEEQTLVPLPDRASLEEAAFGLVVAVGCVGVKMAQVQPGEVVVVIGLGMIGQMSAQAGRRAGAKVIACDVIEKRVELARQHSAHMAECCAGEEMSAVIAREGHERVDVVIETTGRSSMFEAALALIRWEGRIAMQGYYPDPIEIEFHRTHGRRAIVSFPCGWDEAALRWVIGAMGTEAVIVKPLITHEFPAARAPEAYRLLQERPAEALGVMLRWG